MKPQNLTLLIILFLGSVYRSAKALPTESGFFHIEKCARLEGGVVMAMKIENENQDYIPGGSLQYSYCLKLGHHLGLGIGAGVNLFMKEGFVPFYFDCIGLINQKRNSPFINVKAGYAFGWSNKYNNLENPEFSGGYCFGIGIGKKFHIRDKFATYISISYNHQLAELSYTTNNTQTYHENLNYPMLKLDIGLMLEQN